MKKNDVFTFTAPNGVEVTSVVTAIISSTKYQTVALCYAQNRLFTFYEHIAYDIETGDAESDYSYGEVLVDYAILPDYDELLQLHSSMEYPQWEQNLEAEIQGINDR